MGGSTVGDRLCSDDAVRMNKGGSVDGVRGSRSAKRGSGVPVPARVDEIMPSISESRRSWSRRKGAEGESVSMIVLTSKAESERSDEIPVREGMAYAVLIV